MWFLCFSEYHLLQFVFASLRRKFAVLSNPVPDRQPCSALCRVSSLGPLVQTEVMAGFPVKVSDWTVMYFYPKSIYALRVQRKPVHNIQSLSRKPVRIKRVKSVEFFHFQMPCCNVQHSIDGNTCQDKISPGSVPMRILSGGGAVGAAPLVSPSFGVLAFPGNRPPKAVAPTKNLRMGHSLFPGICIDINNHIFPLDLLDKSVMEKGPIG